MKTPSGNMRSSRDLSTTILIMITGPTTHNMKRKFKEGLERIVISAKKHWKETITAIALPFVFNNNVKANDLFLKIYSSLMNPKMYINHINGATENYDTAYDGILPENWPPKLRL